MRHLRPVLASLVCGMTVLGGCFFPPSEPEPTTVPEALPDSGGDSHTTVLASLPVRLTGQVGSIADNQDWFDLTLPAGNGSITFNCVSTSNQVAVSIGDDSLATATQGSCPGPLSLSTDGGAVTVRIITGSVDPIPYQVDITFTPAP